MAASSYEESVASELLRRVLGARKSPWRDRNCVLGPSFSELAKEMPVVAASRVAMV